jgi:signal transduction histidine kinase
VSTPDVVLVGVVDRLATADDLGTITRVVAEAARALAGADGATFVLREGDLCFYADEDAISPLWAGRRFPASACISGWAMAHRRLVVVPDIEADPRIPHDAYRPTFVKSLCMVPVREQDPIAAIGTYWAREHVPSDAEQHLLRVLANTAAVALQNVELRARLARVEPAGAEDASVAHTLAHDLRSPLAAMLGFAGLLEERLGHDPVAAGYCRSIVRVSQRAQRQIDSALALHRLDHAALRKEELDLSALVAELLDELLAGEASRTIEAHVVPGLVAHADPDAMRVVLENLLSNALKFSRTRPVARIAFEPAPARPGERAFALRDNGVGFPPDRVDELFRPLSRLHDRRFAGTGLGLASVARIIAVHGGRVEAHGEVGAGARFAFTLPCEGQRSA